MKIKFATKGLHIPNYVKLRDNGKNNKISLTQLHSLYNSKSSLQPWVCYTDFISEMQKGLRIDESQNDLQEQLKALVNW